MRVAAGCLALAAAAAWGQTWTKPLVPGLTLTQRVDASGPFLIHLLRWKPGYGVTARAEVAGGRVFRLPGSKARETLGAMVTRTQAIGGINADFFPFTGDPLGAMVRDGELISRPDPRRVVFTWTGRNAAIVRARWSASVAIAGGAAVEIDGLNEECGENMLVLYTGAAAQVWAKAAPCVAVPVKIESGIWRPTCVRSGETLAPILDQPRLDIEPGSAVLVAKGFKAAQIRDLQPGTPIRVRIQTTGLDNAVDRQAAGGGPNLVTNGADDITGTAEGLGGKFQTDRHPRSSVGITRQGDVVFAVVDGRQPMSIGMTLADQAALMRKEGCVAAMNFDGGGSSAINYLGVTLNRPSDGEERPIANAVLFFGKRPDPADQAIAIDGPSRVAAGGRAQFQALVAGTRRAAPERVLWSAMGDAWIDGSGTLYGLRPGVAQITAFCGGTRVTLRVPVIAPSPVEKASL